jgi:cellulose synthase operon protein C
LKWSRDRRSRILLASANVTLLTCASIAASRPLVHVYAAIFKPDQGFARWIENVPGGSDIEKALFRMMQLPGGDVLFRRAPNETVSALTELQQNQKAAALYSLRALEEEQKLDFTAAERDWKAWADQADDRIGAHLDLADFYERRLQPQAELVALEFVESAAPDPRERWTGVEAQRSWKAFERALKVIDEYALPHSESARIYTEWLKRYPQERTVYTRQFAFLLAEKDFLGASEAIMRYRSAFPEDRIFPVKAEADLAMRRGQPKDGLTVYELRFEPLWPAELIKSYFKSVIDSHNQRSFGDALRAKLAADPDDLKDAARLFYLYQQQGQLDSAKAVLTHYRESKEDRGAKWTAEELDTFEKLFEAIQDFPEAARYAYALASDHSSPDSERQGVVALARILLTAPEQPLRIGAGNLALYKNIATMDRGPGYLNGILSLLLNTQGPASEYAREDQLAVPYFHRARAAELLVQIDQRFPSEPSRPQLHASLMEAYAVYGENEAVIREGTMILAQYPKFPGRVQVALDLADAYERTKQVDKEFTLYQDLLKELAAQADGVPLGASTDAYSKPIEGELPSAIAALPNADGETNTAEQANTSAPQPGGVRSAQYNEVLNRYLARLVALQRLPDALQVLRGELDRNPQDPGLYERLADFFTQNRLDSHQEEVFQRATQEFQNTSWYAKLARFYVRTRRNADYSALMHKVAEIFSGTELEEFLRDAPAPDESLALEVNLYAHQHFPHDLRFVERLIGEYKRLHNESEVEHLLWEHWSESPELRNQLFEELSSTNRLDAQLKLLRQQSPEIDKGEWTSLSSRNPAAERFWLEASLWQSHYEQGVDAAAALDAIYPADSAIGKQAASLYRSLAYFHPEDTDKAVAVEKHLLEAQPGNLDTLARIGDIYADRERFADAAPYWVRMADVRPGEANGYLQSATVFWDYFDFASAQAQLDKGRTRLNQPTLFGYQEGAIAESRGDLSDAVGIYVASATANDASSESRDRLFALARRPELRPQVEEGTAGLLKQGSPSENAIQLRAGILESEHRKDDLSRELKSVVSQTGSFDVLDVVTNTARSHALPDVEESALRRQITLTTDPVRSLQLRYQLVDFLQQRNAPAAAQEIEAIYREHGKILGVVRATVDYDWDHDRKQQAVSVLLESAQLSYPELKNRFQLEAARKLTDLGDYAKSRTLLAALLNDKPLDPGYEAAMADNLARANDSAGLETFYRSQLDLVRQSSLHRDEKQQRTGELRRGMIAASTQLGNFNDAVDQYIELINAYPDDAALTQEAALYAIAHGARDRLFAFYQKTINDSPRDPRWRIVLARLATAAEDDALAIDAYSNALKLRPERQDLYIAQASLEERLHRLDDAIALYRKLYTLSYHDAQWMEKVAELSARQGRNTEAVEALETGWIEGRPAKASNSFAVAERLEKWGLLDEAQKFAEQGFDQAGSDLLVSEQPGAALYARIFARKRQSSVALDHLIAAREAAPRVTLSAVAQQVVKQGPGAVSDDEWRKQREEGRREQASSGFAQALNALGSAAGEFYTPEERMDFAALLKQHAANASAADLSAIYIPAAKSAGLADLTAEFEWTAAVQSRGTGNLDYSAWLQLQRRRVLLSAAAAQLEKIAPSMNRKERVSIWQQAAKAYRDSGDTVGELRDMEQLAGGTRLDGEDLDRYYHLLLAQRPDELAEIAAREDSAAQYLVRYGNPSQALNSIAARASGRPPVWKNAYTALTGLYLGEYRPEIKTAFISALDADATIGERLAHPADRDQHLAGNVWFYYGSRFGEYLDGAKDPRAEDYLESELEVTPGSAGAYLHLADYSNSIKRADAALADYQHSLDLSPDQPAVLDSIATLQWDQGHRTEALAAWNDAVKQLAAEMDARRVPEMFWTDFGRVLDSISVHHEYDTIRQQVDDMLRIYIARNGEYRIEPLLEAGYRANNNSVEWLLTITSSAQNQERVLYSIIPNQWSSQGQWIDSGHLVPIYQRIVELAEHSAEANPGQYDFGLDSARQSYVRVLLKQKQIAAAGAAVAKVPVAQRYGANWLPLTLAVADADGSLGQLLATWSKQPNTAPADDLLLRASAMLPATSARAVQRFTYQRALDRRDLTAPNFLGLAAIDIEENDTAGALQLLHRLTLVSDNVYADTDAAAKLLEDHHKPTEAMEFLKPLAAASPWDVGYKVRVAKAMLAIDPHSDQAFTILSTAAGDPKASYAVRVSAAQALNGHGAPNSGSGELILLAQSGCPSQESVSKPLFVAARVAAAACTTQADVKERVLHEALEAAPEDVSVRLPYIFAAFDSRFDSRALIAAAAYLQTNYYDYSPYNGAADDDTATAPSNSTESLAALPRAQAARLLRSAIAAYRARRDYVKAQQLASAGLRLLTKPEDRTAFQDLEEQINLLQVRSQENQTRAPDIHPELDQSRIVRPRLLPGMPVPAKPKSNAEEQE